ncbi:MAG: ATP-binding protein [Rhizobiaceae bacterium]
MAQTNYPYLDLTVLPEIRPHVITSRAVLLFDKAFQTILWANGEGASLLGSPVLRDLLDGELAMNPAMQRQISSAIEQLDDEDEVSAVVRIRRGMQSSLLGFSVRHIELPQKDQAVLMVTEALHGRGRSVTDMARTAVDCLDGYSHASAILGAGGAALATSEHFGTLQVSSEELAKLANEVSTEEDRLVKRLIETSNGARAAGIARLSDDPASHILIIADAGGEVGGDVGGTVPDEPAVEVTPQSAVETDDTAAAEAEQAAPAVGAFSNRRSGGTSGLARWYFKQPRPADEPASDENTQSADADDQSQPEAEQTTLEAAASADDAETDVTEKTSQKDDIAANGGLIQETEHTEPVAEDTSETADQVDVAVEVDTTTSDDAFEFTAGPKPIRFVWDMDADNEFRSVSGEFAKAVGPNAANVLGLTWSELCELHEIDNGDEITTLLNQGDTWSGKTVLWPVEGTDLRVPVDLAGLPSYGRNRIFEGFNGFGIVRTADAVVDPRASGLNLAKPNDDFGQDEEPAAADPIEPIDSEEDESDKAKVVDLETRRESKTERALSSDEQETFEEIGEKLTDEKTSSPHSNDEDDAADDASSDFTPSAFSGPSRNSRPKAPSTQTAASIAGTPDHNVDTSILARLPIAVLVYREADLLFGNQQFFEQTGYADLSELARAGGVDALFGGPADEDGSIQGTIYHANGKQLDAHANLQRVPWDENRAMLLTLKQGGSDDGDGGDRDRDDSNGGEDSGDTQDDGDNKSSSNDSDTTAAHTAEIVSLHGTPSRQDGPTRPAFGGLEAEDLRDILDTATDGVVILTDEGIVRALNKSAEALFDIEPDAALDQPFTRLLAPESHRSAMDYLSGMSGTGVASLMNDGREIIGKTAQGGLIPLFMTIGKLQQTDACCAVVRDITHWKKAEEELLSAKSVAESASAQKTEFLAKVSHEIRTPLNAIIGFSDIMIEERFGKIDNDRYRGYLRDIHRSGNHVLELVNDLLDISKIEAGKMELEFDACDLNTTVSETVALTQPDANKERIIIRTSLSAVVPKVVADPRSLRQIILNLVSNSIKFTKPGGQVIVSTVYEESGEVVLRVRDTGIGMGELELARALKPFQQVNAETNTQGTGLGLPLTKAMVEANRARFEIESTPEEGTLVEIYFPNQRVLADR